MTYDEHIDCDNQLKEAEDKIIALKASHDRLKEALEYCINRFESLEEEEGGESGDVLLDNGEYYTTREFAEQALKEAEKL